MNQLRDSFSINCWIFSIFKKLGLCYFNGSSLWTLRKPTMRPVELQSCSLLILLCLSSLVSPSQASIMGFVHMALKPFRDAFSCFRMHPKWGSHCAKVHIARWGYGAESYVDRECCRALADYNKGCNQLPNDEVRSRCAELGVKYWAGETGNFDTP